MQLQSYQEQLLSNNVSNWYQRLLQEKIGGEEIVLTTKCQLSKISVTIPIRHTSITYIHCLFDLDCWMEHYKQMQYKVEPTGFACPGCKRYTNFKDYGVDYTFYHVLEELRLFKLKNNQIKLNESQLIYQPSKNIYYVETKVTNSANSKIKMVAQRYPLPGCVPIFGVSRRQQQISNQHQNETQKRILDEISQTIVKLQQLLFSKLYKIFKINANVTFKQLQDKVATQKHQCKQQLAKSLKVISLGRKSLNDDYVFALKKIASNNQMHSILIVYLVQYGIWYEYDLIFNGQPYVQLEQALYIKGESDAQKNTIYIIGGQKQDRFSQSNQCLQLTFPRNPFQVVEEQVKIVALPDYPLEGYNFMGTSYKGNLFVFYGQRQTKNSDNQIKYQLLNSQYVLRKNAFNQKWEQMKNKLVDRFDGSFFTITHEQFDKLIVLFGGITKDPDGVPNYRSQQQHLGQIFVCKDEKFLGNQKQDFNINYAGQDAYHKSLLASPVFSCPYYGNNQLILSGECLKYKNNEQREIYTFDWASAEIRINELFSLEPPEQIFTPYRRKVTGYDIFSPVQDPQGAIAYGFFYVIHQYEIEQSQQEKVQKITTQLLKINLTNGLFFALPYQESSNSREVAQKNLQQLPDRQNEYL
ncbi:unnamed protein product (macronuclear) [Paramecium tetraurelia]|uniref:Uncharacterized protein n=1 Tax=Paramecium tetraurelia TaxID=5888 RepID=A0E1C3_PARTE|nr:uncharacterized protein GSPATT00022259001 [Paramecium tetraurelia]CAK89090.1 unnamed protein product [Paramecium tetraurelia]|eukprot:XP_001456487.1 hypothetical protein (macronuclear) [Paramecium tetraurelia strain d4-2]